MKPENSISVILPCYNERGNILPLIEAVHDELHFVPHEIIIVDDNSPDGTFSLVQKQDLPFVRSFLRPTERSLAKSIRKGIEEAKGDILIIMDSDFNHQPRYLPMMIRNMEFYDCVSGSRFIPGGKMNEKWRYYCSLIFNLWINRLTRKHITDNLYGYFAIKRETLVKLDFDKIFWGYGDYCIRLMFYLQESEARILEFPAENGKRFAGQGNRRLIKAFFQYVLATVQLMNIDLKNRKK